VAGRDQCKACESEGWAGRKAERLGILFCIHSVNGLVYVLNDYSVDIVYFYISVYYILNKSGVCFRSEHSAGGDSASDILTVRGESNH
jgi:hypothetical protein